MTEPRTDSRRWAAIAAGLAAVLIANYYLRSSLEDAPRYLYSFIERFYPEEAKIVFGQLPTWRLFLPIREISGTWSTTTLIQTSVLERSLTPAGVWYLYNAISILVAFGTTWALFRSAVFSFTFALCIGFGTQFYHAYAVTGGINSYIVAAYHMMLMFTTAQIVRGVQPRWLWKVLFAVSLLFNMFGYEGWLDVLVVVWVSLPFVYIGLRRLDLFAEAARMARMTAVLTAAGVLYLLVKITYGYGQVQGSESDVLFNYDNWRAMADDLVSNVFTHTYLSISNYLPPLLVGSTSMYELGAEPLIAAQHGYHEPYLYLVPMHHVFLWRFYAGAALAAAAYALYRVTLRMWRRPSPWTLALLVFLLMILLPGSTHEMIKFRPMNAMPSMTYHVTVGIIGAGLLLAWVVTTAWRQWRRRRAALALVIAAWAIVLYGALARPPYLAFMAAQGGLGESLYPNPMRTLIERAGGTYTPPPGLEAYRLAPFRQDQAMASARAALGALPVSLPAASEWALTVPDSARPIDGGVEISGDSSLNGYQVMSPPVPLKPNLRYAVRVRFDVLEGRVCGGVLGDNRWLVPPDGSTAEYVFDSGSVEGIRVVLANCNVRDAGNPVSRFRLFGGSYGIIVAP